jgi:hypothetical protein
MSAIEEAEKLLSAMTRSEKAQLLQWVVRDLGDAFPGIESIPGVCGGEPCIVPHPNSCMAAGAGPKARDE